MTGTEGKVEQSPRQHVNLRRSTQWMLATKYVYIGLLTVSGFLLVPLYLRYIPLDLYGAWLATGNVLAWITAVDPGLAGIVQQRVASSYGREDWASVGAFITSGLLFAALVALVVITAAMVAGPLLNLLLGLPDSAHSSTLRLAFQLGAAGNALMLAHYTASGVNLGLQAGREMGIRTLVAKSSEIALVVGLLTAGMGLLSIPLGLILLGTASLLWDLVYLWRRVRRERLRLRFSIGHVRDVARLAVYTFSGRVGGTLATNMDRIVVARFLGTQAVATFSFTQKAPGLSKLFYDQQAVSFMPAISHLDGSHEADTSQHVLIRLMRVQVWLAAFLFGAFLAFNGAFVRLWVGESFYAGPAVNAALCVALVVTGVADTLGNLCMALGNIEGNGAIRTVQGAASVPLLLLGAAHLGLLGVVIARIAACLAVSGWYFSVSFAKLMRLSRRQCAQLVKLLVTTMFMSASIGWAYSLARAQSWLSLGSLATLYALSFAILILLFFPDARHETRCCCDALRRHAHRTRLLGIRQVSSQALSASGSAARRHCHTEVRPDSGRPAGSGES